MLNKILVVILFVFFTACTKMDDYIKYTDGNEIEYAGRAEEPVIYPGKNRLMVKYIIKPDARITKAKIYWRNRIDSIEFPIERKGALDTIERVIDLPEGSYSFEIVNFHESGVKSVPSFISGRVYGVNYEKTLLNRGLISFSNVTNNGVKIDWGVNENTAYGVNIEYTDLIDEKKTVVVSVTSNTITLQNVKNNSFVYYKTSFKPDSTSMDVFYSPTDSLFINR